MSILSSSQYATEKVQLGVGSIRCYYAYLTRIRKLSACLRFIATSGSEVEHLSPNLSSMVQLTTTVWLILCYYTLGKRLLTLNFCAFICFATRTFLEYF